MYHFCSAHAAASSDAMSTVIDVADQAQYGLAYFAQDDKSTTNGLKDKVCSCVFFNVTMHIIRSSCVLFVMFFFVCCPFSFCSLLLVGVDKALRRSCPW